MVLAQHQKQQWLIIDGSAITLFSQGNFSLTYPEKVVFTPHQMEWQRLSHLPIEQQTLVNNQRQQAKLGSTIVLKSHRTTIF
ncbi:NAD(P)H-hydrate dehydratase, partial [Alloscardovia omnicolens]